MARTAFGWAIAHSLIALLCACSRLGAAAPSPEEVLKTHGLKLVGSLYVLDAETDVQKKVTEIRQLARKLKLAQMKQRATGSPEEYQQFLKGLGDQIRGYQSEIQAVNQRMNQIPRYGRMAIAYQYQTADLIAYRNQLQMEMSQTSAYLNQLKSQPFDSKSKEKIDDLVRDEQESFDEALADLRKLVDSATEKYAELHEDSAIKKALNLLAKTAKVKPKLGPSPHYLTNVKLLEKLEKEKDSAEVSGASDKAERPTRRTSRAGHAPAADAKKAPGNGKDE